ncbi:MAG: bifunctional DNA-formamidopyrimidine glycosylase/DNA-(apurinic or apyrimidinic site) lyase [Alphaproteobacteria bacterium]
MPELPEVETVRRGLAPHLEGRRLARVELRRADLRIPFPPDFVQSLTGRRIGRLGRRAKYLVAELDTGRALIMHLGMSGRFAVQAHGGAPPGTPGSGTGPHDHVVLETEAGVRLVYTDHRRFGLMTLADEAGAHPLLRHLGLEPLGGALTGPALAAALEGRRSPIKAALLDQRIVAGIGNIYACEALYRARLSPRRLSGTVRGSRAERLARALREVLSEAVEAGGSSVRDYAGAGGEPGYFQHAFSVYGRAGAECGRAACGATITRIVQGNRSTFLCPACQR